MPYENKLLFLGTGTSTGVPVLGCKCRVCLSSDPRDKRTRVSALLMTRNNLVKPWHYLLIDTSIDLRQQLAREKAPLVHKAVYTHAHVDHFFGLDDLRPVQYLHRKPIELYCNESVSKSLSTVYAHLFNPYVQQGGGILSVKVHTIDHAPFSTGDMKILPLPVLHGSQPVLGYRWGSLAYITDCSCIPEETYARLEGVEILVLDALRKDPHETHFNLDQALEAVERIGPKKAWFIHMTHDLMHEETNAELPEHAQLAYDGLRIDLGSFDPLEWM